MRRFVIPFMGCALAVALGSAAFAGDITGTVKYKGSPPAPKKLKPNKDTHVCGTAEKPSEELVVGSGGAIKNAVVYIEKVAGAKVTPMNVELDQRKCTFTPHVLVTMVGSTVTLKNGDPVMHNIHFYCLKNTPLNQGIPKGGKPIKVPVKYAEEIKIGCDAHKWMSAYIIVRDNSYFAITGADGKFTLKGVPPGKHRLTVWHETLGKKSVDVTVAASGAVTQDFELSK